jgi:hypothetical protein
VNDRASGLGANPVKSFALPAGPLTAIGVFVKEPTMKTKTKKQPRTRASAPKTDVRTISVDDLDNISGGSCSHTANQDDQRPGAKRSLF